MVSDCVFQFESIFVGSVIADLIAKFRWHCISFFSIVRNLNHVKNSLHPRDTKVVINHRVGNFILNSMLSYLSIKSLHKQVIQKLHV